MKTHPLLDFKVGDEVVHIPTGKRESVAKVATHRRIISDGLYIERRFLSRPEDLPLTRFTSGDILICVEPDSFPDLKFGKLYTCKKVSFDWVHLNETKDYYCYHRFRKFIPDTTCFGEAFNAQGTPAMEEYPRPGVGDFYPRLRTFAEIATALMPMLGALLTAFKSEGDKPPHSTLLDHAVVPVLTLLALGLYIALKLLA